MTWGPKTNDISVFTMKQYKDTTQNHMDFGYLMLDRCGYALVGLKHVSGVLRAMPGLSEPRVGSGRLQSLDGRGFSERVAAPTRLSRPGFQSRTEGSSRGATAGKAARRETTSAEWAVLHGNDIR